MANKQSSKSSCHAIEPPPLPAGLEDIPPPVLPGVELILDAVEFIDERALDDELLITGTLDTPPPVELATLVLDAELIAPTELAELAGVADRLDDASALDEDDTFATELFERLLLERLLLATLDDITLDDDELAGGGATGSRFDVHSIALRTISTIFGSAKFSFTWPIAV
jgi:hypothetical protein